MAFVAREAAERARLRRRGISRPKSHVPTRPEVNGLASTGRLPRSIAPLDQRVLPVVLAPNQVSGERGRSGLVDVLPRLFRHVGGDPALEGRDLLDGPGAVAGHRSVSQ